MDCSCSQCCYQLRLLRRPAQGPFIPLTVFNALNLICSPWTHILNVVVAPFFFRYYSCFGKFLMLFPWSLTHFCKAYTFWRIHETRLGCFHQISLGGLLTGRLNEDSRCRHISSQVKLAQERLQVYLFTCPQININTPLNAHTPTLLNPHFDVISVY